MSYWESKLKYWKDYKYIHPEYPHLMLEWSHEDEGFCGDYDENDPNDAPLLRFSIYTRCQHPTEGDVGDWEGVDDTSYCTENPIDTSSDELDSMALEILDEYRRCVDGDGSPRKKMEAYSWITPYRGARA